MLRLYWREEWLQQLFTKQTKSKTKTKSREHGISVYRFKMISKKQVRTKFIKHSRYQITICDQDRTKSTGYGGYQNIIISKEHVRTKSIMEHGSWCQNTTYSQGTWQISKHNAVVQVISWKLKIHQRNLTSNHYWYPYKYHRYQDIPDI